MPERTVNDIRWHYEDQGSGRPVVLLHAFPLDGGMYAQQAAELSKEFRVIRPDLPGFGRTAYDRPFTVKWQAEQVRALLAEIDALPCVIGGCSVGGYVAIAFEKEFPRDADALILIDTKAEGDNAEQRQNRDRLIGMVREHGAKAVADGMIPKMLSAATKRAHPEMEGRLHATAMGTSSVTLAHALAALRDRPDQTTFLPSVADPALILVGAEDTITPPSCANLIHDGIRHATLRVIDGAGHLTPLESPEAVSAAIGEFVRNMGK